MGPGLLLAVDVGTLSARAGVFEGAGALLGRGAASIPLHRPGPARAVYRMAEVWAAVGVAIRAAVGTLGDRVVGVAFDATSSLALSYRGAPPLEDGADVFCWADHRGEATSREITATGDRVLDVLGGTMSPEMHLPKLLWLKRADPAAWARLEGARDLCDALAWRATGVDAHSLCGLACKWPYLPHGGEGWRTGLLERLGLGDLLRLGALGQAPLPVGAVHGRLLPAVAAAWGVAAGVPVAAGLIDAEAGTLGALERGFEMNGTAVVVGGTSTCIMAFAREERRVPGVWGPFHGAVFPGVWLHEAGQSWTGAALDAVLEQHPGGPGQAGAAAHAAAAAGIARLVDEAGFAAGRHVVPDWLGNRSPLGDGSVRALVLGLGEEREERDFLEAYYAAARGIALQVRQVLDHLDAHGYAIRRVVLSGGHARNPVLVGLYRDALDRTLVLPRAAEPVLLGTAMVAGVAAGVWPDLVAACDGMAQGGDALEADAGAAARHAVAYRIYRRLFEARGAVLGDVALLSGGRAP